MFQVFALSVPDRTSDLGLTVLDSSTKSNYRAKNAAKKKKKKGGGGEEGQEKEKDKPTKIYVFYIKLTTIGPLQKTYPNL